MAAPFARHPQMAPYGTGFYFGSNDAYEIGYEKIIDTYAAATQHERPDHRSPPFAASARSGEPPASR